MVEQGRSKGHPGQCPDHGDTYVYEKQLRRSSAPKSSATSKPRKPRKPMKRSQPQRDWTDALAKVEEEGCCRICKRTDRKLDAAHVLGREHDEPKVGEGGRILQTLYVHPDRIIPACGPFPEGCHGDIDMRRINLLPHLTLNEQIQAVRDAGGIEAARIRLAPVEHKREVEASAYEAVGA